VMVRRTPVIDQYCADRFGESGTYVVVPIACSKLYIPGETLSFATGGNAWQYASGGWYQPEGWGVWSAGLQGGGLNLTVPAANAGPYHLIVDAQVFLDSAHRTQTVTVEVNGTDVDTWTFDLASGSGQRSATIPTNLLGNGTMRIVFKTPGAVSPAQATSTSADTRVLGIGLRTLTINR
jgi:arabinofuranosyltransferase